MASINTANIDNTQKSILRDVQEDLATIRATIVALLAKLDADSGVGDTDYAATLTPDPLLTKK
jgi:hypothetical protein